MNEGKKESEREKKNEGTKERLKEWRKEGTNEQMNELCETKFIFLLGAHPEIPMYNS